MRDLCDFVYVLHLDAIERQVTAERQVAATFMAGGAKGVTLPTFEAARADFDHALLAVAAPVDGEKAELMAALGVGHG